MSFDWQNVVAICAAASAAIYLAWRGYRAIWRKRMSCGGCGSCSANVIGATGKRDSKDLVIIEFGRTDTPHP
jgi:hypothetical protein